MQLDELFALLSAVKDSEVSEAEAIKRLEQSPQWVWVVRDPESKLLVALDLGNRTLAMAQRVVHQVAQVLAPDCAPLFLTDGFREYLRAVLTHYGYWVQPPRRQGKGPLPKPRWRPLPQLLYAQGMKTVRRRRLVRGSHRVVFGTLEAVQQVLSACGWQINTAFVERINLTIRQHVAAVGRRVSTLCKGEDGLRQQVAVFHCYYNCCLPHASVCQPLPQPQPTHGTGSATQWRPCTPAMAAGLTAVHDIQEAMRDYVKDIQAIQATLEPDRGTGAQRQEQFQGLQVQCQASDDPIRQHMGRVMASFAPGLFVGGDETDLPQDNLDLERWCRQPKGHERRIHGHQHAGVRLVQEGPTLLLALDAHLTHPEPFTAAELWPYRHSRAPACQQQALQRRTIMHRARSKKKRPMLLAELEHRYLEGP